MFLSITRKTSVLLIALALSLWISCGGSNPSDAEHQPHVKGTIAGGGGSAERNETGYTSAAYYVSQDRTIIYGASAVINPTNLVNVWTLAFDGNIAGTFSDSSVWIAYNVSTGESFRADPGKGTIAVSSYGGVNGFIEGTFSAVKAMHIGASPVDADTYQILNGSFRAYRVNDVP